MVRVDKPENVQDETNSELDINRHNRLNPYPVRIGIVHEMLALVTAYPIKGGDYEVEDLDKAAGLAVVYDHAHSPQLLSAERSLLG